MKNEKIKIGVTYTGSEEKHNNYVNWLKGNDDIDIITLSVADNNLDTIKGLDALIMTGGVDVHPENYNNWSINYPNAPAQFQPERDAFETKAFKLAQEEKLPVLAICRGMQLVNCILGGNLTQDMGPQTNALHRKENADAKHEVNILPGTLLKAITHAEKDNANSDHHQCVNEPAKGLRVNALSADGIIEGYEWENKTGKPFLLGVQWHPERMYTFNLQLSTLSKNIRDYFINELKKNRQRG